MTTSLVIINVFVINKTIYVTSPLSNISKDSNDQFTALSNSTIEELYRNPYNHWIFWWLIFTPHRFASLCHFLTQSILNFKNYQTYSSALFNNMPQMNFWVQAHLKCPLNCKKNILILWVPALHNFQQIDLWYFYTSYYLHLHLLLCLEYSDIYKLHTLIQQFCDQLLRPRIFLASFNPTFIILNNHQTLPKIFIWNG